MVIGGGDDTNEMGYEKERNEIREPHLLKSSVERDLQFRVRHVTRSGYL